MAVKLETVVPWGRSLAEYRAMFSLGDADERIETVLAAPREALLIGTPPALPMLLLHRVSRDTGGRPLERVRTLFRGDRFSFSAHQGGA